MPLFELSQIEVTRGDRCILRIPDLEIEGGGFLAVVGPNGAGKTTLLRLLAGQLSDYRGSVWFMGQPIQNLDRVGYARKVQYVFQHPLFLSGTVFSNLQKPLLWHGWWDQDRQQLMTELLREFQLSDKLGQSAQSLSGGEAQRLSLLRSLLFEPEVLLVDEPTANVDAGQAELIGRYLRAIAARGTTVFVSTHDQDLMKLVDRMLYLRRGEVSPQQS